MVPEIARCILDIYRTLLIEGAFFISFKGRNRGRKQILSNKKGLSKIAEPLTITW
jgi:hypothetical protein